MVFHGSMAKQLNLSLLLQMYADGLGGFVASEASVFMCRSLFLSIIYWLKTRTPKSKKWDVCVTLVIWEIPQVNSNSRALIKQYKLSLIRRLFCLLLDKIHFDISLT